MLWEMRLVAANYRLIKKAESLYSAFLSVYNNIKPSATGILDRYSVDLLSIKGLLISDTKNKTEYLLTRLREILVSYLAKLHSQYTAVYMDTNNILDYSINKESLFDRSLQKVDFFTLKFVNSLKNDIETEYLLSKDSLNAITKVLPPDNESGMYQGRLKTMLYMIGLSFINDIAITMNEANGLNSIIIDLKKGETNGLKMKNGVFKTKHHMQLWIDINGYFVGDNTPSHFGSREIIMPIR